MPRYSVSNILAGTQQALAPTAKTILSLHTVTGSLRRLRIKEIVVGLDGSPANNAVIVDVVRTTAAGTATAATPNPLDPADPPALGVANVNHTVEPTVIAGSSILTVAMNQQATLRWVAPDSGDFVSPAVNLNGLAVRLRSPSYTGTAVVTVVFEE